MPYALVNTCKEAWVSAGISAEHHVRRKDDKQTSSKADSVSRVDERTTPQICYPDVLPKVTICCAYVFHYKPRAELPSDS